MRSHNSPDDFLLELPELGHIAKIVIMCAFALAQPAAIGAQTAADTAEIETSVVLHVRSAMTVGLVRLDPRLLGDAYDNQAPVMRPIARTLALARVLGASVGPLGERLVCSRTPGKCHLEGIDAAIALGDVRTRGDSASVHVTIWQNTITRRSAAQIHIREVRVLLLRSAGVWRVMREVGIRET